MRNSKVKFFFRGFDKEGKLVRGSIQATSVEKAIANIHDRGVRTSRVRQGDQKFHLTCFKANALCEPNKMSSGFCDGCGG